MNPPSYPTTPNQIPDGTMTVTKIELLESWISQTNSG